MSMSQIRTYSKNRPKTVILNEIDDTIFDHEQGNKLSDDDTDLFEEKKLKKERKGFKNFVSRKRMRPVKAKRNVPKKLKSTRNPRNQHTKTLEKKPLEMLNSPFKGSPRCKKTKQLKERSQKKSCLDISNSQKDKKSAKFSWSGSENSKAETSIEILRKDEGMTWQQKISFLLPKMHQEYPNELQAGKRLQQGKTSNAVLNISAEEILENMSESNCDDDYTYTWVTESATNTKSNTGQHTVPSTNIAIHDSTNRSNATLVPVDSSKSSGLKKSSDHVSSSRTGKLKLPVAKTVELTEPSSFEFIVKDKGISFNQKWNSTIQKDAKNIKDYGFPTDISSIVLSNNTRGMDKTEIQRQQETTPNKNKTLLYRQESNKIESRPKKKSIKQLTSTKMFLSDMEAFEDIVPEMSTIKKGKLEESIELTREKSPFIMQHKTASPITPILSPKKDNEQVFTSTPTKDKNNKDKEFPEFDLSSVQIPEFDEDELAIHESREVNSQEIVCECTEDEIDIPEPVILLEKAAEIKKVVSKEEAGIKDFHVIESTKYSQNSKQELLTRNKSADIVTNNRKSVVNTTVVSLNKSLEHPRNLIAKKHKLGSRRPSIEECCIATFSVPVKPLKKANSQSDYKHILRNTPIDCIQQIYQ